MYVTLGHRHKKSPVVTTELLFLTYADFYLNHNLVIWLFMVQYILFTCLYYLLFSDAKLADCSDVKGVKFLADRGNIYHNMLKMAFLTLLVGVILLQYLSLQYEHHLKYVH